MFNTINVVPDMSAIITDLFVISGGGGNAEMKFKARKKNTDSSEYRRPPKLLCSRYFSLG